MCLGWQMSMQSPREWASFMDGTHPAMSRLMPSASTGRLLFIALVLRGQPTVISG